jgi:hypothetical protein
MAVPRRSKDPLVRSVMTFQASPEARVACFGRINGRVACMALQTGVVGPGSGMDRGIFLHRGAVHAQTVTIGARGDDDCESKQYEGFGRIWKSFSPEWGLCPGDAPPGGYGLGRSLWTEKYIVGTRTSQC